MLQNDTLSYCRYNLGKIKIGYSSFSSSFSEFVYVLFHPYWREATSVQLAYLSVSWVCRSEKTLEGKKKTNHKQTYQKINTKVEKKSQAVLLAEQTTLAFRGKRYKYLELKHSV